MQIRCSKCHKPFALSKNHLHAALDEVVAGGMSHYNASCPHCRKINRVSRKELERAAPDWQPQADQEE